MQPSYQGVKSLVRDSIGRGPRVLAALNERCMETHGAKDRSEFCRICESSLNSSLPAQKECVVRVWMKPKGSPRPSPRAGLVMWPEPSLSQISKSGFSRPFRLKSVIHPSSPTVYCASLSSMPMPRCARRGEATAKQGTGVYLSPGSRFVSQPTNSR